MWVVNKTRYKYYEEIIMSNTNHQQRAMSWEFLKGSTEIALNRIIDAEYSVTKYRNGSDADINLDAFKLLIDTAKKIP